MGDPADLREDVDDLRRRAEWFESIRGHRERDVLQRVWHDAVGHLAELRRRWTADLAPPSSALAHRAELLVGTSQLVLAEVDNPRPADSRNFVTPSVAVGEDALGEGGVARIALSPGAAGSFDPRGVRVFRYDEATRRWNIVEHSGYDAAHQYAWARVTAPGTYAAIGLPAEPAATRKLAVLGYVHTQIQLGAAAGTLESVDAYFDANSFSGHARDVLADGLAVTTLDGHLRLHGESLAIRADWPRALPNGGLPEWQILEQMERRDAAALRDLRVKDVTDLWLRQHLANRVGRWHRFGPDNVAGRVKSLAIHPTNGDILYAGAANGGVWKTTNGGASWSHLWKFQDTMAVGAIAVAPSNPHRVYAATGEDTPGWGPSYGGVGVYRSDNDGGDWAVKGSAAVLGGYSNRIVVHPTNPDIVYVATNAGVFKTINGGDLWTPVHAGHATDLVLDTVNPDTLYAAIANSGIWKTTNGGSGWDRLDGNRVRLDLWFLPAPLMFPFPSGAAAGWIKLAIGRDGSGGTSFLVAKMGPDSDQVFISRDGGAEWQIGPSAAACEYNEWTSLCAVHPRDHSRIFLGSVGLQYTGPTGQLLNATGTHSDHHQIVFHPSNDNVCFVCCDGGVYRSANRGASWTLNSAYLTATQLVSLGVSQSGTFVLGGATQDQGIIQTDGTTQWSDFGGGNEWGMYVVDPNDSRNIYVSPGDGFLRRSTDRGRNWSNPTMGLTEWWAAAGRATRPLSFAHVAVQPGASNLVLGCGTLTDEVKDADGKVTATYPKKQRVYYSCDTGVSWTSSLALDDGQDPSWIAFSPSSPTRVYVGTRGGKVYKSDASGLGSWYECAAGAAAADRPPAGRISCVCVHQIGRAHG